MQILLIEDDRGIADLIRQELEEKNYQVKCVDTFSDADVFIAQHAPTLMIVDYSLHGSTENAGNWIKNRQENNNLIPPFIMSTGQGDERIAVQMMKLGARDYLVKDRFLLDRLPEVVGRLRLEIENEEKLKVAESKITEINEFYRSIIENATDGVVLLDKNNKYIYASPSSEKMFGYQQEELGALDPNTMTHPDDLSYVLPELQKLLEKPDYVPTLQYRFLHKNGNWIWIESTFTNQLNNDNIQSIVINFRNISERKRNEIELQNEQKLKQLLMEISSSYINIPLDQVDASIYESLGKLARFVNADRCYIFQYNHAENTASNTYEWCEEGIDSKIENLQNVPFEVMDDWIPSHFSANVVYIPDIKKYHQKHARDMLEMQGIKSLIAVPMMDNDKCIGFTGFDSVKQNHNYSENEQSLLKVFAQLLVNIHKRKNVEESLNQKIQELLQFQRVTVGRELTMIELKKEVNTLLVNAGKEIKYKIFD